MKSVALVALAVLLAGAVDALQPGALARAASRGSVGQRSALVRAYVRAAEQEEALYEDDLPPKTPPKPPVSKSMRAKLIKENSSLGGDPNSSYGNPFLVIGGIIAVLAVLVVGGGMA